MFGSSEEQSAEILPINSEELIDNESDQLDDALTSATDSMLRSLEEEDRRRNQRWFLLLGVLVFAVPAMAIVVMLSNPKWFDEHQPQSKERLATVPQEQIASTKNAASQANEREIYFDHNMLPTGDFTMHLPRGFEWPLTIKALNATEFRLTSPRGLNSLGIYELKGNLLTMKRPVDKRLTEFQWKLIDRNNLVLVAEPPAAKTGATYLGAKLIRN